jgi:signal transduction histidine kinase
MLVVSTLAAGALMVALFDQSTAARAGQAQAELGRACDGISAEYRFFASGWAGPSGDPAADEMLKASLTAVVDTALRGRAGVEGGVRLNGATSLAYAYPTYQGSGPKTDEPPAEKSRIGKVNSAAMDEDRSTVARFDSPSQTLLVAACPLPGPIAGLTAWTMTRINSFAGASYDLLMAGIVVLLIALAATAILLGLLLRAWSRHVTAIESALQAHDVADLPRLPATGERELDRIVAALNDLGERLDQARREADDLTQQLAAREHLAALGRVAAGVAHEIRNPIAAMRLRAETALKGDPGRQSKALITIIEQVDRVAEIVSRIIGGTEGARVKLEDVDVKSLLGASAEAFRERAKARGVDIEVRSEVVTATVDPAQIRTAIGSLLTNAIEASPEGSQIELRAERRGDEMVLVVRDHGRGVPPDVRARLFEPFASVRADSAGLGLATVRAIASAHQGVVRLADDEPGATFEIALPCRPS